MKILLTGGRGFLGRPTANALRAAGHEVTLLVRDGDSRCAYREISVNLLAEQDQFIRICNRERPDALVHLAWETGQGRFWIADSNLDWVASSIRLARAFIESGGKHLFVAGTCVEYDSPAVGPCIPGVTPLRPMSLYAVCKDALRRMLEPLCELHGVRLVWGRVFFLFGPAENPGRLVPQVVRALLNNETAKCSSGGQIRDFLHVEDAGRLIASIVNSGVRGEVNIASGTAVTIGALVSSIAELAGNRSLLALGALPDRPGEPQNLWGDTSDLFKLTGFSPSASMSERLAETIAWHRVQTAA